MSFGLQADQNRTGISNNKINIFPRGTFQLWNFHENVSVLDLFGADPFPILTLRIQCNQQPERLSSFVKVSSFSGVGCHLSMVQFQSHIHICLYLFCLEVDERNFWRGVGNAEEKFLNSKFFFVVVFGGVVNCHKVFKLRVLQFLRNSFDHQSFHEPLLRIL